MRGMRGKTEWVVRATAVVVALGLFVGCSSDVVPEEAAPLDREIELPLDNEPEPELSDVGEPGGGEVVAEAPAPPPAPVSTPVRRTPPAPPPQAPPADPAPQEAPEPAPIVEEPPEMQFVTMTAAAGSELEVELLGELSTRDNQPGDGFTARVTSPIIEGDKVLVPMNSTVRGEVTAVQKSGGSGEEAVIKVRFIDVMFNGETWPMSASVVEANPETRGRYSTGDKVARGGAGAVAGAILGRVIGGNSRGTVIGAAVGAAAGTAITLATEDVDAVLPEGSKLRLRLDEPLTFRVPAPIG